MRVSAVRWIAWCLVVAGCGLFRPRELVTGRWGGRLVLLDATTPRIPWLRLPCEEWVFTQPLVLDEEWRFEGEAQRSWVSGPSGIDPTVRVSGVLRGDEMTLEMTFTSHWWDSARSEQYLLRRGAEGDFYGVGCLAEGAKASPPVSAYQG